MKEIVVKTWSDFKSLYQNRNLDIQYNELIDRYEIFLSNGYFLWTINLLKNSDSDVTDFETNFKSNIDSFKALLPQRSFDNINYVTTIKNFSDKSISRVSPDFSDKTT